jgi:hypothetical protein
MKMNFTGVALGALAIGLMGAGEAKADAIGYAALNFSSAYFSLAGSSTPQDLSGSVDPASLVVSDNLKNNATFDGVGSSTTGTRTNPAANVDPALAVQGTYGGGQNNFTFTATNTNFARSDSLLTGNLLAGSIQSNQVAEVQATNNHIGNVQTSSTSTSSVTFSASTNLTLQLNLGGTEALYTKLYAGNKIGQAADAAIAFSVTLRDVTAGANILNYAPTELNTSLSELVTPSEDGATTPTSFSLASGPFTLVSGHTYQLQITQGVQADATAVPEPGTLALFGVGLAGLGFLSFRRQNKGGNLAA